MANKNAEPVLGTRGAPDDEDVVILETTVGEALAMTEEEFVEWALAERERKLAELGSG